MKNRVPVFSKVIFFLVLLHLGRIIVFNRPRDVTQFSVIDDLAVIQMSMVALMALFLLLNTSKTIKSIQFFRRTPVGWFLMIYIIGLVSTLWSKMPAYTFYRATESILIIVAILTALYWIVDQFSLIRTLLAFSVIVIFMGLIGMVRLNGFSLNLMDWHSNSFTAVAAMGFSFCIGEILDHEGDYSGKSLKIYLLFFFLILILGTSSGSFLAALSGMAMAFLINKRFRILVPVIIVALILVQIIGFDNILNQTVFYGKTEATMENLSGREFLWDLYWKTFKQNPLLGEGFSVTARINPTIATTNTHNSFLAIATGMGLVGLTVFFLFIFGLIRIFGSNLKRGTKYSRGAAAAVFAGIVNSMTISIIGEGWGGSQVMLTSFLGLFILSVFTE